MKTKHLFFLLCSAIGHAQSPHQILEWVNTAKADNTNFYYEVPFDYRNNEIVIEVGIGNQKYDYIFDTGGYNNITNAIQEKNNFPVLTSQTVGSSNKLKSQINIVRLDILTIGDLVFRDIAALQMDFSKSPTIGCTIDGGLIGASIIKNYIWQIDYPNKKIIITDQKEKLPELDKAIRIPVTFNSRLMPYIDMEIGGQSEKVMFDLGSSTLFSMTKKTAKRYHKKKDAIVVEGGATEGGNGIIKEAISIFKATVIQIGPMKFKNKPVYYTDTNNESLVGNPIIKNYIVTMNFKDSEMYFSPIAESPVEAGWKSFGFTLDRKNKTIEVATLYEGLPAKKAGLRLGDRVIAIDGKPIECADFCECKKLLSEKLSKDETIDLTIVRDKSTVTITVKKETIF